ncbi:hypothetical protein NA57DRAFT_76635 [Rhizodiscina lignyota]|uniref:Uncharacterized protein n=1 Tax=Rhizodiscina lignyota TaxID=1504668 RepID=A0A9P4M5A0_9PEZI|nr:hypothetical protein NA57DRAFT_76635 [Rhizodiscina lignyota]
MFSTTIYLLATLLFAIIAPSMAGLAGVDQAKGASVSMPSTPTTKYPTMSVPDLFNLAKLSITPGVSIIHANDSATTFTMGCQVQAWLTQSYCSGQIYDLVTFTQHATRWQFQCPVAMHPNGSVFMPTPPGEAPLMAVWTGDCHYPDKTTTCYGHVTSLSFSVTSVDSYKIHSTAAFGAPILAVVTAGAGNLPRSTSATMTTTSTPKHGAIVTTTITSTMTSSSLATTPHPTYSTSSETSSTASTSSTSRTDRPYTNRVPSLRRSLGKLDLSMQLGGYLTGMVILAVALFAL